ncbi:hypothetical protein SEA_FIRECASTLE_37 [Microbacterium phage FireCastle]
MDIYTTLALLLIVFGCSSLLGYWAGVARKREDRLREKARAWDAALDAQDRWHYNDRLPNPYRIELERRNAR